MVNDSRQANTRALRNPPQFASTCSRNARWAIGWGCLLAFTAGWLVGESPSEAQAPDPLTAGASGVLVLKNGNVIEGVIERVGDRYRVLVGRGEIGVPEHQVQMFADSRLDAYQQMQSRVRNTVLGHLEIAQWCVDQSLFPQAADELLAAMRLEPRDPRIASLQRRLEVRARTASLSVVKPNSPSSHTAGIATTPAQSNIALVANHATAEAAPEMSDQPPVVLEEFRRTILPLMLNGCAANRCHGNSQAGGFALYPARSQHFSRRLVERNWEAVIEWLEPNEPKSSTLLHRARTNHGLSETPPLAEESDQYRRLADWVERQGTALHSQLKPSADSLTTPAEAPVGFPPAPAAAAPQASGTSAGLAPQFPTAQLPHQTVATPQPAEVAPLGRPGLPQQTPQPLPQSLASDPFDPEVFNRRYHPDGKRMPPAGR